MTIEVSFLRLSLIPAWCSSLFLAAFFPHLPGPLKTIWSCGIFLVSPQKQSPTELCRHNPDCPMYPIMPTTLHPVSTSPHFSPPLKAHPDKSKKSTLPLGPNYHIFQNLCISPETINQPTLPASQSNCLILCLAAKGLN